MSMSRNHKRKNSLDEEEAVDASDHAQNPPQILFSSWMESTIVTVSVSMDAKDLKETKREDFPHSLQTRHMNTAVIQRLVPVV